MFPKNSSGGYIVPAHSIIATEMNFPAHSVLGEECQVAPGCTFGTGAVIGKGSIIGRGSKFRDHAVVGEGTVICKGVSFGHLTTFHDSCCLNEGVSLGSDCVFKGSILLIGGGQRIGDRAQFESSVLSARPFIVGKGAIFADGRPTMAIEPHEDIVRAERSN